MNTVSRQQLFAIVLLTITFSQAAQADTETPTRSSLTATVRVHNYADVPKIVLKKAKQEVEEVFSEVGVTVLWLDGHADTDKKRAASSVNEPSADSTVELRVHLLSRAMAERKNRKPGTVGEAISPAGLAWVYWDRVEDLVEGLKPKTYPSAAVERTVTRGLQVKILGRVIAHELGHLLLPFDSHSPTGIMSAFWSGLGLGHADRKDLVFTDEQADLIRGYLSAA